MKTIIERLKTAHFRIPDRNAFLRHLFHGGHATYFGAVFFEGHGFYALAGLGLGVLVVLNYFLHFE